MSAHEREDRKGIDSNRDDSHFPITCSLAGVGDLPNILGKKKGPMKVSTPTLSIYERRDCIDLTLTLSIGPRRRLYRPLTNKADAPAIHTISTAALFRSPTSTPRRSTAPQRRHLLPTLPRAEPSHPTTPALVTLPPSTPTPAAVRQPHLRQLVAEESPLCLQPLLLPHHLQHRLVERLPAGLRG